MVFLIEGHAHVEYDVWMPHLVHDFYLFDEVSDALLVYALSRKSLDCHRTAHPLGLEHLSIASTSEKIILDIDFEIIEIYVKAEAILIERLDQVLIGILVQILVIILAIRIFCH